YRPNASTPLPLRLWPCSKSCTLLPGPSPAVRAALHETIEPRAWFHARFWWLSGARRNGQAEPRRNPAGIGEIGVKALGIVAKRHHFGPWWGRLMPLVLPASRIRTEW